MTLLSGNLQVTGVTGFRVNSLSKSSVWSFSNRSNFGWFALVIVSPGFESRVGKRFALGGTYFDSCARNHVFKSKNYVCLNTFQLFLSAQFFCPQIWCSRNIRLKRPRARICKNLTITQRPASLVPVCKITGNIRNNNILFLAIGEVP